jgi:PPM family protein phosphatase
MAVVEIHATSHIGRVRKGNEDNYLVLRVTGADRVTGSQEDDDFSIKSREYEVDGNGIVCAVSDGMGGALAGEVASTMAVETVGEHMLDEDTLDDATAVREEHRLIAKLYDATVNANYLIHNQGRTDPQFSGMGATFTGTVITRDAADIVQVGDSRAYLIRGGKIKQITKDQSLVQQLIDAEQISEAEAETHNLKNVILQALGAQMEIYPVSIRVTPCRDDILILCSDGLSNKLSAGTMLEIVTGDSDLGAACGKLVDAANEAGGEDNITVIVAKFSGEELPEDDGRPPRFEMLDLGGIHDTAEQEIP